MSFQDMEGKDPFQVTEGQLHMSTISSLGMEPRTQEPYQLYFSARPEILPLYFILEAVFRSWIWPLIQEQDFQAPYILLKTQLHRGV